MAEPARSLLALIAVLALAAAPAFVDPTSLAAQVSAADSAAVLLEAGRAFESEGRPEVAEALYRRVLERYAATPAGAEARAALDALVANIARSAGSVELRIWMTAYGTWLGVALPAAFDAGSSEAYGVGLLAGAPAGFLVGRALDRSLDLTEGRTRAITFGGTWGTWQGFGWQQVFEVGVEELCEPGFAVCYEEDDFEEAFAAAVVGGLTGLGAGILLAGADISPGTATTVNNGALWGSWFGVAGGVLMDLDGDDLLSATLIGGNAGLVATALLAPGWDLSRSRSRLITTAGLLGGIAGAGIDLIAQPDDEKVAVGIPLVSSVAGLAIGTLATREASPNASASLDIDGSEGLVRVAEGRIGIGVPIPRPTMLTVDTQRGTFRRPGVALTLLDASF